MQGFTRCCRPANFSPDEADHEAVQARGREIYRKGLGILADKLGEQDWVAGDDYSIGDCAAVLRRALGVRASSVDLPAPIAAHLDRMLAAPRRAAHARRRGPGRLSRLPARAFWFLRHGETDWNAQGLSQGSIDIPLNATGIAQAAAAAQTLRDRGIASIVSSPLSRARDTARGCRGRRSACP